MIVRHGSSPFRVVVIHGGPAVPGTMAPVARGLIDRHDRRWGVLEPYQRGATIADLVADLERSIQAECEPDDPVVLVGSSWGGMLSIMFAAEYPALVRKVVLVGSASFDEASAASIMPTRMERLTAAQRAEATALMRRLQEVPCDTTFLRIGHVLTAADCYDPVTLDIEIAAQFASFSEHSRIWQEAVGWRKSGRLLQCARQVVCPVVAYHGEYDPHPVDGIRVPLRAAIDGFRLDLIPRCGHYPWIERDAAVPFFEWLDHEIEVVFVEDGSV